ncbi:MAG TPA: hypothetical protein ENK32_07340 [Anaerolineae bacterium]|nr:hypothetical protein [Anaerolineae bacterium]
MLTKYLHRLYDTVISRGYIEIEYLDFDELPDRQGTIEGRLRFYDSSLLEFDEAVLWRDKQIVKLRYAYHYQDALGKVIFRYDNVPHHPDIITFPHHKHTGSTVEPAQAPDLSEVLQEIEALLFA